MRAGAALLSDIENYKLFCIPAKAVTERLALDAAVPSRSVFHVRHAFALHLYGR